MTSKTFFEGQIFNLPFRLVPFDIQTQNLANHVGLAGVALQISEVEK